MDIVEVQDDMAKPNCPIVSSSPWQHLLLRDLAVRAQVNKLRLNNKHLDCAR